MKSKFIVGIDEAGRGALAGPVAVATVAAKSNLKSQISRPSGRGSLQATPKAANLKILENIKDSKKLSPKKREEWYRKIKSQKSNLKSFCVFINHKTIDKINVHQAALLGVEKVLKKLKKKPDLVLLDGSLRAPEKYKQKTIIKGDEKIPIISAASIIAKVARDRKMIRLHKKYPKYSFDRHKGYGTKLHYKKIRKNGLSKIHRRSFCKNLNKFNR